MKNLICVVVLMIFFSMQINAQNFVNGNFDQGPSSGWTSWSKGGFGLIGTAQFFSSAQITPQVIPRSGQYMARLGGFSYEECYIKQTVTLPNTPKVYMKLYYQDRAFTGAECAGLWVGARIRVAVAGQIILDQYQCYYNTVNVWTNVYFDLSAAAGKTVEIIFQADAASTMWSYLYLDDISITSSLTGVEDNESLPREFKLEQNYPNPFNPETTISYKIQAASKVSLKVYDVLGREIATLVDEYKQPGNYNCKWRIENGEFPSGVYFYQLRAGDYLETKKCTLMK